MYFRLKDRLKYRLERWIQRGALFQLLVIAGLIALVAVVGGLAAWAFGGGFSGPADAIWWAFLRLTDPGYLGDDAGALLRTISTVVTVLGYVLFMGSLIAILTQWLNVLMRTLERGLTPIALRDHILILGWTNRTGAIVQELLLSEGRVQRFLQRRGTRKLRIVILAEQVDAALAQELRDLLGAHWDPRRIILRSGSSLRIEHLRRVAYRDAAIILLPGADFRQGGAAATDTRAVKTLISISNQDERGEDEVLPIVVGEILDTHMLPIAQQAYRGDIDLVASDAFISRLIAQNVRHRGLSFVYGELLSYTEGHEVYVRQEPHFAGLGMQDLIDAFPKALLLGAVRPHGREFRPYLNPPPDFTFAEDDRLVLIARTYEDSEPAAGFEPVPGERWRPATRQRLPAPRRRLLILGWNHKVVALLREFESYSNERFHIDIVSVIPKAEREDHLTRHLPPFTRLAVRQIEADYTVRTDLVALAPTSYDNVVFLGSDWLDSGEESDARTILGYVLLRSLLPAAGPQPEILVELMDPENNRLFAHRAGEVIISPLLLSHVLAHVALRRELNAVFGELFGPAGAEIFFRPAPEYELSDTEVDFRDVRRSAARRGEVALGIRLHDEIAAPHGGIHLNPLPATRWRFSDRDEVIVLTTM